MFGSNKIAKISKRRRNKLKVLSKRLKYICENSSIHGLHFVVKDRSVVYRTFWLINVIISFLCMMWILLTTLESFSERTINFNVQTTYLGWNTTFPAITVCELFNGEKLWDVNSEIYGRTLDNFNDFIGDIAFFYGTCFTCEHCVNREGCPTNFTKLAINFRSACKDLFDDCKWNGEAFNCCASFLPLETEFGVCYSFNSLHTKKLSVSMQNMMFNTKSGLSSLEIRTREDHQVFIHPPEEVPFINIEADMKTTVLTGNEASLTITILEVINDPEVKQIPIDLRVCRFPNEKPENYHAYSTYSYSGCIVQCHIDAQLSRCNCTHHLMPSYYRNMYCDIKGLQCLTHYYAVLATLKAPGSNIPGLECKCLPSCNEPEYSVVDSQLRTHEDDEDLNKFKFAVSNFPSLRYNRQVVRTSLDLIVAVGNAIGLFFGASILSIVEIVYYLIFRKWN